MSKVKFFLSVIMFVMMLSVTAAVTVDHSSKQSVVKAYIQAVAEKDQEALWQILPENLRKLGKDVQSAKKIFWTSMESALTPQIIQQMQQIVKNPKLLEEVTEVMCKEFGESIVQVDGKWYIDFLKLAAKENSTQQVKNLKAPEKIDHSTPKALIETFYLALVFKNVELYYSALTPGLRAKIEKTSGKEMAAKMFYAEVASVITPQIAENLKAILSGPQKKEWLEHLFRLYKKGNALEQVDGKWYIDPTKLKKL